MVLRYVPFSIRVQDFDASAAVSPSEAAAQLRASMGGGGGGGEDRPSKSESVTPPDEGAVKPMAKGGEPDVSGDDDDADDDVADPTEPEKKESVERGKEPVTPPDPASKKAISDSPLLNKILAKYDGDPDKFAEALYNMQNSNAEMHGSIKELKERFEALTAEDEDEEIIHPDAAVIEEDIESFNLTLKENAADQASLVQKGEKLRGEMATLRGELKHAEPDEKRGIEAQIEAKQERLETLADKWKALDKDSSRLSREIKFAERRKEQLKGEVDVAKAKHKEDREKAKQWQTEQRATFDTAVKSLPQVYKMSAEDVTYLHGVIKAEASLYLRSMKESENAIDLKKFVEARAEIHTKRLGLPKLGELKKKTEDKRKVTEPVVERTPAPRAPAPHSERRTPDNKLSPAEKANQARLHAQKVLGG